MLEDFMPESGVKELKKSKSGNAYLEKLQKKYHTDLLQPGDPMFEKVYGDKIERDKKIKKQQEATCNEEKLIAAEKKSREEMRKKDPGYKKYY